MATEGHDEAVVPDDEGDEVEWRCYRHPHEEAGVRCRRCERAICPKCMITAPVGFQCPECVKGGPAVRRVRPGSSMGGRPPVTTALVAVNAVVFVFTFGRFEPLADLGLFGPAVAGGEWWRLVTSAFMHVNVVHVGFNCLLLWQLGNQLEPALGRTRFGLLYAAALFGGDVGVLMLDPVVLTAGASGAVFGLMGGAVLELRHRGIDPWQTGLGPLIVINLVLTFAVRGISIGGHLGGLAAGAASVALLHLLEANSRPKHSGVLALGGLTIALVAAGLWLASNPI